MIRIDALSFGYRRRGLYQDFGLTLGERGVHGLFGPNGSGKSTLLKLIAGLLFPRRGSIEVLGFRPAERRPAFLASVYIVPEEFHLPDLSARELVRTHAGFYPRFSREAFAEYLAIFELPDDRRFQQMSLGHRKKAAIAFALATFTELLLLDEPTNGLDIVGRDRFRQIMQRPEQRERITLISTHQAHDLERIISHILFLDTATLALSAPLSRVAAALTMGHSVQQREGEGLIYQEPSGAHFAWVEANRKGTPGSVQLELLYKALSHNKDAVLAALRVRDGEGAHV